MASKKSANIDETATDVTETTATQPASDYVRIINLTKIPMTCPLRNGRSISIGPKASGLSIHVSEPILKKERTPILFEWEKRGKLAFEELKGERA